MRPARRKDSREGVGARGPHDSPLTRRREGLTMDGLMVGDAPARSVARSSGMREHPAPSPKEVADGPGEQSYGAQDAKLQSGSMLRNKSHQEDGVSEGSAVLVQPAEGNVTSLECWGDQAYHP